MKNTRYLFIAVLFLILTLISACGPGQQVVVQAGGDIIFQELELSDFEKFKVRDMFKVDIVPGQSFRVMVEVEESLVPYLEIDTRWKTLEIGLKPGYDYRFQNAIPRVEVMLPTFTQVAVAGKSNIVIHDFNTLEDFELKVDDFSSLSAVVEADSIRVDVSGHSGVILSGVAQQVTGNVKGQSTLDMFKLATQEITVAFDQHSQVKE